MVTQKDPKFSDHLMLEKYVIQVTKELIEVRGITRMVPLQSNKAFGCVHFFPLSTDKYVQ